MFDRDYVQKAKVSVDTALAPDTTVNNLAEVYPKAHWVEFFIPPSSEGGMDWTALRLVFEPLNGSFYCVGIIHHQWTP